MSSVQKTALVTGFTGQDGTFLTDLLLKRGYKVVGLCRRISTEPPRRVRGLFDFAEAIRTGQLVLALGDLGSVRSLVDIIGKHQPDEIYNLAAQSHVGVSFNQPELTIETDFLGVVNLVNALEIANKNKDWRLYQASTSEMFGDMPSSPVGQDEDTPFAPNSPYSIAKAAAHYYVRSLRQRGCFASAGILFNHESEIRGGDFVTQKIARAVAAFKDGKKTILELGNLEARRDWGYAGDYVEAMWLMLQHDKPGEWVIGTGETHSVRQFVEAALEHVGLDIEWQGEGEFERGTVRGEPFVVVSKEFYRPLDVNFLKALPTRAKEELGWQPTIGFKELVAKMVDSQREV